MDSRKQDFASNNNANGRVFFLDVQDCYSPDDDIFLLYKLSPSIVPTGRDWIGLYRADWLVPHDYITFEWAPKSPTNEQIPELRSALFPSKQLTVQPSETEAYQFVYVSKGNKVLGCSQCFRFLETIPRFTLSFMCMDNEDDELDAAHALTFVEPCQAHHSEFFDLFDAAADQGSELQDTFMTNLSALFLAPTASSKSWQPSNHVFSAGSSAECCNLGSTFMAQSGSSLFVVPSESLKMADIVDSGFVELCTVDDGVDPFQLAGTFMEDLEAKPVQSSTSGRMYGPHREDSITLVASFAGSSLSEYHAAMGKRQDSKLAVERSNSSKAASTEDVNASDVKSMSLVPYNSDNKIVPYEMTKRAIVPYPLANCNQSALNCPNESYIGSGGGNSGAVENSWSMSNTSNAIIPTSLVQQTFSAVVETLQKPAMIRPIPNVNEILQEVKQCSMCRIFSQELQMVRQHLVKISKERDILEHEITETDDRLSMQEHAIKELQVGLKDMGHDNITLSEANSRLAEKKPSVEALQKKTRKLMMEKTRMKGRIAVLRRKATNLDRKMDSLQAAAKFEKKEHQRLQDLNGKISNELTDLAREANEAKAFLNNVLFSLSKKGVSAVVNSQGERRNLGKTHGEEVSFEGDAFKSTLVVDVQRQLLKQQQETINCLQGEVNVLEQAMKDKKLAEQQMQGKLGQADGEIEDLQKNMESLEGTIKTMDNRYQALSRILLRERKEKADLKNQLQLKMSNVSSSDASTEKQGKPVLKRKGKGKASKDKIACKQTMHKKSNSVESGRSLAIDRETPIDQQPVTCPSSECKSESQPTVDARVPASESLAAVFDETPTRGERFQEQIGFQGAEERPPANNWQHQNNYGQDSYGKQSHDIRNLLWAAPLSTFMSGVKFAFGERAPETQHEKVSRHEFEHWTARAEGPPVTPANNNSQMDDNIQDSAMQPSTEFDYPQVSHAHPQPFAVPLLVPNFSGPAIPRSDSRPMDAELDVDSMIRPKSVDFSSNTKQIHMFAEKYFDCEIDCPRMTSSPSMMPPSVERPDVAPALSSLLRSNRPTPPIITPVAANYFNGAMMQQPTYELNTDQPDIITDHMPSLGHEEIHRADVTYSADDEDTDEDRIPHKQQKIKEATRLCAAKRVSSAKKHYFHRLPQPQLKLFSEQPTMEDVNFEMSASTQTCSYDPQNSDSLPDLKE